MAGCDMLASLAPRSEVLAQLPFPRASHREGMHRFMGREWVRTLVVAACVALPQAACTIVPPPTCAVGAMHDSDIDTAGMSEEAIVRAERVAAIDAAITSARAFVCTFDRGEQPSMMQLYVWGQRLFIPMGEHDPSFATLLQPYGGIVSDYLQALEHHYDEEVARLDAVVAKQPTPLNTAALAALRALPAIADDDLSRDERSRIIDTHMRQIIAVLEQLRMMHATPPVQTAETR